MNTKRLLQLLIPTVNQVLVSVALALVIHVFVLQSLVVPQIFKDSFESVKSGIGSQGLSGLAKIGSIPGVNLVVEGLFAAIAGLCGYLIYLALSNALIEARNEVVVDTQYTNRGHVSRGLRRLSWQVGLTLAFVIIAVITSRSGINLWFFLTEQFAITGVSIVTILEALGGVLGLGANIYLLWIMGEAAITAGL